MKVHLWRIGMALWAVTGAAAHTLAQNVEGSVVSEKGLATPSDRFRLKVELKANGRHSRDIAVADHFPFPTGTPPVFLRTVSAGSSLEVSNVSLVGEADFTPDIAARTEVHILDLYNRNPTSSDDRVQLREAWLRFGRKYEALEKSPGSSFYLLVGKAPRFTKPTSRRLESYGLWSTAVGRFEEVEAQAGGSLGPIYFRAQVANGNPLFMRDPNALAGDNGTPERTPENDHPIYQSGFPILYDTKAGDLNRDGRFEYGAGLGVRLVGSESGNGIDLLGWYFHRRMADSIPIRGTFYSGDLKLLDGNGIPLPFHGRRKTEAGVNLEARLAGARLFSQYVRQDIAGLVRRGWEAELAYRIPLPALISSGEEPLLNYVQPAVRYSRIENDFTAPAEFVAPSFAWDWRKWDMGIRIGILRGVDLTAEYAHHEMITRRGPLHPDETLVTLRAAF